MNRRHALASILTALLAPCHAEEKKPEHFATHVTGLLPCDRVEVLRLSPSRIFPEENNLTEEQKRSHYELKPFKQWCEVLGKITVKVPDAERLATLLRAFQEYVHPERVGWSICHFPPYAYRFYSGDKLVGEFGICWECHNILIDPGNKGDLVYFKNEPKRVKELLEASNKLFPDNPAN